MTAKASVTVKAALLMLLLRLPPLLPLLLVVLQVLRLLLAWQLVASWLLLAGRRLPVSCCALNLHR